MNQTEKEFSVFLDKIYEHIDQIIDKLNTVHNENMKHLEEKYESCIQKLHGYKSQIVEIQVALNKPQPKFYFDKLSEIKYMDLEDLDEEKKLWDLKVPKFQKIDNDYYKFDEFPIFKYWKPAAVDVCEHSRRTVIVTLCKKAHCKECLTKLIADRSKNCPCGTKLSPKNIHEVMGFGFKISYLFQQ